MFYSLNLLISKGGHNPLFTLCIAANKTHLPQPSTFLAWVNRAVLPLHRVLACASLKAATKSPFFFPCYVIPIRNSFVLNNLVGACCNMERAGCLNHRDCEEGGQEEAWPGWALLGATRHVGGGGSGEIKKCGNCYVTLKGWNILYDKVEQDLSFRCECSRV